MSDPITSPQDEVDLLLPWYATGRLSPTDSERVRRELDVDPALAQRLALAEEEQAETRAVSEALPVPSARARDQLFARIGALEGRPFGAGRSAARGGGVVERILGWIEGLGPSNLAWAGAAAALLIVLQAGLITANLVRAPGATYTTASHDDGGVTVGTFALVSFAPGATAAQITAFLSERQMAVVDGPRGTGLYRVRVSATALDPDARERALAGLRGRPDIVAMVIPSN